MRIRAKFIWIGSLVGVAVLLFILAGTQTFHNSEKLVQDAKHRVNRHLEILDILRSIDQARLFAKQLERHSKDRIVNRLEPSPGNVERGKVNAMADSLQNDLLNLAQNNPTPIAQAELANLLAYSDSLILNSGDNLENTLATYRQNSSDDEADKTRHRELLTLANRELQQILRRQKKQIPYNLLRHVQLAQLELELHAQTLLEGTGARLVEARLIEELNASLNDILSLAKLPELHAANPSLLHIHDLVRKQLIPYVDKSSLLQSLQKRELLKAENAIDRISDSLDAGFRRLSALKHQELDQSSTVMDTALRHLSASLSNTYFLGFLLATGILALMVLLLASMARSILSPLLEASRMAGLIASGDYNTRIGSTRPDELGELSQAMDLMAERVEAATSTLEARNQELEQKNRELESYSYTVAHDLRTPLVTISGFLHELRMDLDNNDRDGIQNDMAIIQKSVNHMSKLLEGLLQISRLGKNGDLDNQVSLATLFTKLEDIMQGELKANQATLEIANDLPIVEGDALRLQQLFQNLLENALKYRNPDIAPAIKVSSEQKENAYQIRIQDNGKGIPPQYAGKIFGLFEKLEKESPGVGLGLAMSQRITEMHGGRIWAESQGLGYGSTFVVELPVPRSFTEPRSDSE